jgi:uncharacterized protein VirK/YbjX
MISEIIELGKRIYDTSNPREVHRLIVFVGRAMLHYSGMKSLQQFFAEDELRQRILAKNPFPMEQVTRAFFYNGSTFAERDELIRNHFKSIQQKITPEWGYNLHAWKGMTVWESEDQDVDWQAYIGFAPGQRKEGLLSVGMSWNHQSLYQIMFWLNQDKSGEDALWIGAMQGPNMENAKDIIKDVTKRSFRYRTKNLILYMTMAIARALDVKHIYAVSNEGYYANNHVRRDRKLKTDFGSFWEEAGGYVTDDPRFYEIPLVEPRKTMDEVPTRKRAVYRKRFAFLDEVDEQIANSMKHILLS